MTRIELRVAEPPSAEVRRAIDRMAALEDAARVAVLPDVHLAEDVCIGTVLATRRLLYPAAVGGDIGCGMTALRFDGPADLLAGEEAAARVLAGLYRAVPANRHAAIDLPPDLAGRPLSDPRLEREKGRDGRVQFATLGRGNHFLELQSDPEGRLWLLVHSGSRAIGQAITACHSAERGGLSPIEADGPAGRAYLADHAWAVDYARANRAAMVDAAARVLADELGVRPEESSRIECHHNHVRRESHDGEDLWVHRKGALPADEGEQGIIPGSMGTATFHVEGRGCEDSLRSSSHGAGRAMSRSEARRVVRASEFLGQMRGVWFDHRRADALREEAPAAYKDVRAVLRAQRELTKIVRELRPVLSYKAV